MRGTRQHFRCSPVFSVRRVGDARAREYLGTTQHVRVHCRSCIRVGMIVDRHMDGKGQDTDMKMGIFVLLNRKHPHKKHYTLKET